MIFGELQKVDILAIGVHPDDIELSCSGTLLNQISKGYTVGLLDLTQGELGTRGNAEIRRKEAFEAAQLMGAKFRVILKNQDGFINFNEETSISIIEIIRASKPKIVFANAKSDRHPDHGRAAKITADAAFLAGLEKIETNYEGVKQEKWRPNAVYHYLQDYTMEADFAVDITPFFDKKLDLIYCFSSQFDASEQNGPKTPISGKDFLDYIQAKNILFGRLAGYKYAEAYQVNRLIGVNDIFKLD